MLCKLKMPDLSTTGSDVVVLQWLVQVGDDIKRGQFLMEVETDKAVTEVEAAQSGKLLELLVQPGDKAATGQVIAVLEVQNP